MVHETVAQMCTLANIFEQAHSVLAVAAAHVHTYTNNTGAAEQLSTARPVSSSGPNECCALPQRGMETGGIMLLAQASRSQATYMSDVTDARAHTHTYTHTHTHTHAHARTRPVHFYLHIRSGKDEDGIKDLLFPFMRQNLVDTDFLASTL